MDGTAGATQPTLPRLPQLALLHRCHLPYCPYHRVASIRPPRGNSRCQSELRHNHSPLVPVPSTLTCLPHTSECKYIIDSKIKKTHTLAHTHTYTHTSEYKYIIYSKIKKTQTLVHTHTYTHTSECKYIKDP